MANEDSKRLESFDMVKSKLESEVQDCLARGDTQNLIKAADRLKTFIEETKKSLESEVRECLERGDTDGMLRAADTMKAIVDRVDRNQAKPDPAIDPEATLQSADAVVVPSERLTPAEPAQSKAAAPAPEPEKKKNQGMGGFIKLFFDTKSFLDESADGNESNNTAPAHSDKAGSAAATQSPAPAPAPAPSQAPAAAPAPTPAPASAKVAATAEPKPAQKVDAVDNAAKDQKKAIEATVTKATAASTLSAGMDSDGVDDIFDNPVESFAPEDNPQDESANAPVNSSDDPNNADFQNWANRLSRKKSTESSNMVNDLIASLEQSVDKCNTISEKLMSDSSILEGCLEALRLLDCQTAYLEEADRTITISRDGQLLALMKVAVNLNEPSRKELGELCIEITREWGKNGNEPKGIFLYNAYRRFDLDSQEEFVSERTVDEEFTKMAEKNSICLLALEQLLYIVGSSSVEKVSSAKIIDKIVSANGVVEANEIHLL